MLKNNIYNTQIVRSLTEASYFEELDNSDIGLIFFSVETTFKLINNKILNN
jgi:hypothetical protein